MDALAAAACLPSQDVRLVARRLYAYNTAPKTRRLERDFTRRADVAVFLGIRPLARWRRRLAGAFSEDRGSRRGPWRLWVNRGIDRRTLRHKIYVSPVLASMGDVLAVVASTCEALDVPAFKVGATLDGLLRPDKIVVYLPDRQAVGAVGAELRAGLRGAGAQGVPFTTPLDPTGLLSCAVDPVHGPAGAPGTIWSWRTAIAWRLAESITISPDSLDDAGRIEAALARLRADGIDPVGWHAGENR